jgi:2-polyprenyl-6-methoxyphenol hydroxylase-like FAD-dependent oxidoreductase
MSAAAKPRFAIIGAGLGGLTAALALRRIGLEPTIYEQSQRFARVGAGIQFAPNAMRLQRALGAETKLREVGLEPKSNLNLEHDTGKVTNDLPLAGVTEKKYGAPFLCIHRADAHAALESMLPPEMVRLKAKLVGIDQDASSVTLTFADGTTESVDALIAADGIHSIVREKLFGVQQARYTGRVAYRATYPSELLGGLSFPLSRIKWWGPDRHVVMYYTRPTLEEFYVTPVMPEPADWMTESWSAKGDVGQVLEAFREFHPHVRKAIEVCPSIYKWAILDREPMPRWSEGRITLLGDAAHAMAPHMAQGGAQAMEDAVMLARCLEGVDKDGIAQAFLRYEAVRKPRTAKIQRMAAENTWMRHSTSPDWVYGYDALTASLDDIPTGDEDR